ncbi:hypothetical protein, partial [Bacillus phage SPG24]
TIVMDAARFILWENQRTERNVKVDFICFLPV